MEIRECRVLKVDGARHDFLFETGMFIKHGFELH